MRNSIRLSVLLLVTMLPLGKAIAQRTQQRGERPARTPADIEELRRRIATARTPADREEVLRLIAAQRGASSRSLPSASGTTQAGQEVTSRNTGTNETSQEAQQEDEYPGDGPAIDVEILFVELIADKDGPVRFTGTMTDVEKQLRELKDKGKIVNLSRISTSAVDGNKSQSQIGAQQPVVRSASIGGGRGRYSTTQSIGTLVTVIPYIEEDGGISLKLQIEKSWLQGENSSSAEPGEPAPLPTTATVSIKSAVRVRNGRVVTVASSTQQTKGGSTQIITLATAKLAEGEKAPAPVAKGPHAARTVKLAHVALKDAAEVVRQLAPGEPIALDFDPVSKILILRGPPKLVGDLVTVLENLDAEQKPAEKKPDAKKAKD